MASTGSKRIERWPLAIAIVLLAIVIVDASVYRSLSSWRFFDSHVTGSHLLEQGLIQDRIALLEFDRQSRGPDRPRVFLIGSSRMNRGFHVDQVDEGALADVSLVKLAHPQFFPFEIRSAIDDVVDRDPDVVVFALGELETHSRLKVAPGASFGSLGAIADVVRAAGPGFIFERRGVFYKIALGAVYRSFHYRDVIGAAGLDRLRSFEPGRRFKPVSHGDDAEWFGDGQHKKLTLRELQRIVDEFDARFPGRGSIIEKAQFGIVRSITRGTHAKINLALVRRSIALLRERGVSVVLVEPPIYPRARALYDEGPRADFLAFAQRMVDQYGVRFVSLDDEPPYGERDFGDLTHLDSGGAKKFTRTVTNAILAALRGSE